MIMSIAAIEISNGGDEGGRNRQSRPHPLLLHREDEAGVGVIHGLKGDLAIVFNGAAFLRNIDYLAGLNTNFATRNLGWSEEATRPIIGRALNVDRLAQGHEITPNVIDMIMGDSRKAAQVPSVVLIRKASAAPGHYFAVSSQRKYFIETSQGETQVDYHILRSVDERYRSHSVGRWMVELLLLLHGGADRFVHRSSNPMALDTNRKTPNLRQTDRVPYDRPLFTINPDGSINSTLEYEIAKAVLAVTVGDRFEIDENSVVRGLYRESNRAYVPDPDYPDTYNLWKKMNRPKSRGGWGMRLPNGDTVMPIYWVK